MRSKECLTRIRPAPSDKTSVILRLMASRILQKHTYCKRKVFSARLRYLDDRGPPIELTAFANMMREGMLMLLPPLEHTHATAKLTASHSPVNPTHTGPLVNCRI